MDYYIGNQTAFFTTDPEEPFKYALEHNFSAFEWFADKKQYENGWSSGWGYDDITDERAAELVKISEKSGIRYSVHASIKGTPLTHSGMKDIFRAIEVADAINASVVNIHLDASEGITAFVQYLEPVIIATDVRKIKLAIENTPLHSPEEFNAFFEALKESDYHHIDHVGMCVDIGHANCCEATRNDYIGFIDRLSDDVKIIHAHIHENWGDSDSHLSLFTAASAENDTGIRLFIDRLKARGFSGSLIMEQWPDDEEVLDNIFRRLSSILGIDIPESTVSRPDAGDELAAKTEEISQGVVEDSAVSKVGITDEDYEEISYNNLLMSFEESDSWVLNEIIEFSKTRKSWRRRLEAVKELFLGSRSLSNSDLAAIAVYLRFLSTAEIPCVEDGGHYRPCHHAKAALEIEDAIESLKTDSNSWILRKIFPYLPSYAEEFMRHEPLTRIRDIAHRNDIPKELKLDIKHNLQNKLHRSAGPEDLKTARRILKIITAEGADYSQGFVEEFKVFYEELKEFFNAVGLEKRLGNISNTIVELSDAVGKFLREKSSDDPLVRAQSSFELRQAFKDFGASSGAYSFTVLRLADIELEDYAFATISESINELEREESLSLRGLDIIIAALEHIVLSEFEKNEAVSILSEMKAWRGGMMEEQNELLNLHLWASLQRGLRLCTEFADIVNREFTGAVITLGKAFKIPRHAVEIYCEGDIRANVIFQLSRILVRVQRVLRSQLGFAPWSVVNGGIAEGEVVEADSLEEFEGREGRYIVLLHKAEGDEEIPAAVSAVLLAHPIAHLSHLGVRARSGGIPFAAAEAGEYLDEYKTHIGKSVALEFNQYGVVETNAGEQVSTENEIEVGDVSIELADEIEIMAPVDIYPENCGSKAGVSSRLFLMSEEFTSFIAPRVVAIPYGVMELCLEEDDGLYEDYERELGRLDNAELSELEPIIESLTDTIMKVKIPESILVGIAEDFDSDTLLAVRSSSSGEDLEGFAGAGLYESVIGVRLEDLEDAVKTVWASIWTRRAVLSRRKYGISHSDIYMGVLIQEVVDAEFSFIMHTASPVTGKTGEVGIELAAGYGETLASANQAGSPCRINYYKDGDRLEIERCADISYALVWSDIESKLVYKNIDYSKFEEFLGDRLVGIGRDLAGIGLELEEYFGMPQDIEGAYSRGKYYIVQSRPQSGIERINNE